MSFNRTHQMLTGLLTVFLLLPAQLIASGRLNGALGNWLAHTAIPHLVDVLTTNPRLVDERIRIMALVDGHPLPMRDRLSELIGDQITQALLKESRVQVVLNNPGGCLPIQTNIILGIEVKPRDSGYQVTIAAVDPQEGVWINATRLDWQGRLTRTQRRAHAQPIRKVQSDLYDANESDQITAALYRQISCQYDLAAPVYVQASEDVFGQLISRKLRSRLSRNTAITSEKTEAASFLRLKTIKSGADSLQLVVELTTGNWATAQAVAGVQLIDARTGQILQRPGMRPDRYPAKATRHPIGQIPSLISDIYIYDDNSNAGICRGPGPGCVEIGFELRQNTYLLLLTIKDGAVTPINCDLSRKRMAGDLRFRLKVPADGNSLMAEAAGVYAFTDKQSGQSATLQPARPGIGFYALGITDKKIASALNKKLNMGSEACGQGTSSRQAWGLALLRDIRSIQDQISWRSIHLFRDGLAVSQL